MKTELISIKKVKPNPANPRFIKDDAFRRLVKSLQDCPDLFNARPLICSDRTGELIVLGGNMRLRAAKELKYKEVPVIIMPGLTEEREQEIAIKDNGGFGEWDFEALANEWSHLPLADWGVDVPENWIEEHGGTDGLTDPDAVPEVPDEPTTKTGDLYLLGKHRLLCGDSTKAEDVARLMGGKKADMCFADPPYGVGYEKKSNEILGNGRNTSKITNDNIKLPELEKIIRAAFQNIHDNLAGKSCYYICSPQGGELGLMMMMMQDSCIPCRHMIIWVKNNAVFSMGRLDYDYKHEPILYGWTKTHNFYGKNEVSVWEINRPHESKLHPTMKPVELVARAINNSTKQGDGVLDLFLGSGTTLIASEQLGRICYGMEIDPHYCDVIVKRWEDFTGKKAEKANGDL